MSYGHGPRLAQLLELGPCHVCPEPANGIVVDERRYCPPHARQLLEAQEANA